MVKKCQSKKKEQETRKYFKYDKEEHIAKDYKGMQLMKKYKVQEESDNKDKEKDKEKEQSFGDDLEQAWYKRSPM